MKKVKLWMMAAILFCGVGYLTSCNGNGHERGVAEIADENRQGDCEMVIEQYLTDSIGKQYAPGEVCIPYIQVVKLDDSIPDSVLVWGDFWVFNYKVEGDTLKTVSGGAHPGMFIIQHSEGHGYVVTGFDQVADGSDNLPSAQRIFGDKYEAFHAINSNEEKREEVRAIQIADYVKAHNLPVKYYQDYGWPAKEIPVN